MKFYFSILLCLLFLSACQEGLLDDNAQNQDPVEINAEVKIREAITDQITAQLKELELAQTTTATNVTTGLALPSEESITNIVNEIVTTASAEDREAITKEVIDYINARLAELLLQGPPPESVINVEELPVDELPVTNILPIEEAPTEENPTSTIPNTLIITTTIPNITSTSGGAISGAPVTGIATTTPIVGNPIIRPNDGGSEIVVDGNGSTTDPVDDDPVDDNLSDDDPISDDPTDTDTASDLDDECADRLRSRQLCENVNQAIGQIIEGLLPAELPQDGTDDQQDCSKITDFEQRLACEYGNQMAQVEIPAEVDDEEIPANESECNTLGGLARILCLGNLNLNIADEDEEVEVEVEVEEVEPAPDDQGAGNRCQGQTGLLRQLCIGSLISDNLILDREEENTEEQTTLHNVRIDPFFNVGDGRGFLYQEGISYLPTDIAILPDQKILISGNTASSSTKSIFVARFFPDGTLDRTFSQNGFFYINFQGYEIDNPYSSPIKLIVNDNSIVLLGSIISLDHSKSDFVVALLDLDDGSELAQKTYNRFPGGKHRLVDATQDENTIYFVGSAGRDPIEDSGLTIPGEANRVVIYKVEVNVDQAESMINFTRQREPEEGLLLNQENISYIPVGIESFKEDGALKIIIGGDYEKNQNRQLFAKRYIVQNNNRLIDDPQFGNQRINTGYISLTTFPTELRFKMNTMKLTSDHEVLFAGTQDPIALGEEIINLLLKLDLSGNIDIQFGNNGFLINSAKSIPSQIAIQNNGSILSFDWLLPPALDQVIMAYTINKYSPQGNYDSKFGEAISASLENSTKLSAEYGSGDYEGAIAIQSDGKILMTLPFQPVGTHDMALGLVRFIDE